MPVVLSTVCNDEGTRKKRQARVVFAMFLNSLLCAASFQLPIPYDVEMIQTIRPGNLAKAASAVANASAFGGLLEFAFNPTLSRMGDCIGRKPFFLVPPFLVAVSHVLLALKGKWAPLVYLCRVLRQLNLGYVSGVGMMAMLGDVASGKEYAVGISTILSSGAASVIVTASLTALIRQKMGLRGVYAASAALATCQVFMGAVILEETLPSASRQPFDGYANPFTFWRLFTHNRSMTKMLFASAASHLLEQKTLIDFQLTWYRSLDLSVVTFRTLLGFVGVCGQRSLGPAMIARLGMDSFTTISNTMCVASHLVHAFMPWSRKPSRLMYLALVLMMPGCNGASGNSLKSWAAAYATRAGISNSEFAGQYANLRALVNSFAPALWANLYLAFQKAGLTPSLCWIILALLGNVMPELVWRSIPRKELLSIHK